MAEQPRDRITIENENGETYVVIPPAQAGEQPSIMKPDEQGGLTPLQHSGLVYEPNGNGSGIFLSDGSSIAFDQNFSPYVNGRPAVMTTTISANASWYDGDMRRIFDTKYAAELPKPAGEEPLILPGLLRIDEPSAEPVAEPAGSPQRLTVPLNGELHQGKDNPPGETAKLQEMLKELGYGKLLGKFGPAKDGVDDDYGPSTASAVRAFQQVNGLAPTGQLDKETARLMSEQREQLAQTLAGAQVAEISVKPSDLAGPSGLFNSIGIKPADIAPPVQAVAMSTASIVSELSATLASFGDDDGRPVADRLETNAPQQRRPQNGINSP